MSDETKETKKKTKKHHSRGETPEDSSSKLIMAG